MAKKKAQASILSPFDGTVALYHVEVGDVVVVGEKLLEVESMKTFMRVDSTAAGTVSWLEDLGVMVGHDQVIAIVEYEE